MKFEPHGGISHRLPNTMSASSNMSNQPENTVRLPATIGAKASLSPLEKSLLAHFMVLTRPGVIVETGVYHAVTTEFMLEVIELNKLPSRVVGFDLAEVVQQLRTSNEVVRRAEMEGRLQLVEGLLPDSVRNWVAKERPRVGLALIDAQHEFPHVTWELEALWPHLTADGVILGHDYCAEFEGVRYAFDAFARKHGGMLMPLGSAEEAKDAGHGSVLVALRKPAYARSTDGWLKHHGLGWKANFARSRVWRSWLRPLFKRGQ